MTHVQSPVHYTGLLKTTRSNPWAQLGVATNQKHTHKETSADILRWTVKKLLNKRGVA